MTPNRRLFLSYVMSFLLFLGTIATANALSGVNNTTGLNLECTNDLEEMSCDFDAQNCSEYSLSMRSNEEHGKVNCNFRQCASGLCCCSLRLLLIVGETHTATVSKGGETVGSKHIDVKEGVKPRTPTIITVKESNGNYQVKWKTNMETSSFGYSLQTARVTYYKKRDAVKKVSDIITPTKVGELNYYEILGKLLEPSTTYVISVQSYTLISGRHSDSSEEYEFTTPMSSGSLATAVIIALSLIAILLSCSIYGCYVKLKRRWAEAKCPYPKLIYPLQTEHEVLKPVLPDFSSISVEPRVTEDCNPWPKVSPRDTSSGSPLQSSSSCISYANTGHVDIIAGVHDALGKAFPGLNLISPLSTIPTPELNISDQAENSGSSCFDNRTYSMLIPSNPPQNMAESSAYRPSEAPGAHTPVAVVPFGHFLAASSSSMQTDESYKQCSTDSGRASCAEESSFSSISSGTNEITPGDNASRMEAGCESCDETLTKLNGKSEGALTCDENPFYGAAPARSGGLLPVDDDYQAFPELVEQPHISFSENGSGEKRGHVDTMPQNFLRPVVPGLMNNIPSEQCFSEDQRPFLSLISADQSVAITTDCGYHSV